MAANRFRILFLIVILVLIAAVPASASSPDANLRVKIVDFAFRPRTVMGVVGDTVTWRNNGAQMHTSSSFDFLWDSGILNPGDTFSRTFDAAGTFRYYCDVHPFMTARVIINP